MRRSICYSEPQIARSGQTSTWKFQYTTANSLPEGTRLKFDILSQGRDIDWEVPSVNLEEEANVIYLELENGQIVQFEEVENPNMIVPQFTCVLPKSMKIGQKFTIFIGAPPTAHKDSSDCGNECQLTIQRRRPFYLYIDPKGKGNYEDPEIFTIDIRGNKLHTIKILTPSFVVKNKRFDITVRFEDEFGNLTNFAPTETLIELSYEHLRENLNWKLFVPEAGFVTLPNLYFNEAGVYRIQLKNLHNNHIYTSPPIKCFAENSDHLFWGLLHGESERVDSTENIENCLRHFRDEKAFNFFATSSFDSVDETSNELWKTLCQNIADFNEEDRFVAIPGFQYRGEPGKEGLREILYYKDNKSILRQKELKNSSLEKIYKTFTTKDILSIPTFTMGEGNHFDFKEFNQDFERVVEIYNAWGSSEEMASTHPITGQVEANPQGSIIEALKKNLRFGFVAGGLDDRGIYSEFYHSEQLQYNPGLTAIICEKYTRESILEALAKRNCYATTGARIIVGFYIAGHPMGSELSSHLKPGLMVNRHLSGYVAGTDKIKLIEIIRNGKVMHTFQPKDYHYDYQFDDMEPLDKITLDGKEKNPFVFYYLRVTQENKHIAWSSPIWIDYSIKIVNKTNQK
ncbi:MAG: DUF3604 domain-containing protein [Chlamydiales bacterium]